MSFSYVRSITLQRQHGLALPGVAAAVGPVLGHSAAVLVVDAQAGLHVVLNPGGCSLLAHGGGRRRTARAVRCCWGQPRHRAIGAQYHTHTPFTSTATIQAIPFLSLRDQFPMASRCLEVGPRR
jgi:hypothetical protein